MDDELVAISVEIMIPQSALDTYQKIADSMSMTLNEVLAKILAARALDYKDMGL